MEKLMMVEKLNVAFDGKQILHDVSMEVRPNRITAIIGPSGCGKTTFLRCLNGILWEESNAEVSGSVLFHGKEIREMAKEDLRRQVGLVFQTPSPFPFSIYKNMTYALKYYGGRSRQEMSRIAEEKLKMAGLFDEVKDDLNKSALKLSGGQKQRLCIARALTVEPEILLLDEPCSALDVKASAIIEDMLMELKKHYTIVIVTHNIAQAKRIADNAAFFYEGHLVEQGDAKELFENPKEAETRSFLSGLYG